MRIILLFSLSSIVSSAIVCAERNEDNLQQSEERPIRDKLRSGWVKYPFFPMPLYKPLVDFTLIPWKLLQKSLLAFAKYVLSNEDPVETRLYDVLGIRPNATETEIKKGYHKMALKYHPDRNKHESAEEHIRDVNQAYTILMDPDKRWIYDRFGEKAIVSFKL